MLFLISLLFVWTSSLMFENLSYRIEESEFTIIVSASTELIDNAIEHAHALQNALGAKFPKLIKTSCMVYNSITKALSIREKFTLVAGEKKKDKRNVFTDITGSLLGGPWVWPRRNVPIRSRNL